MRSHGVIFILCLLGACGAGAGDAIETDGGAGGPDSGDPRQDRGGDPVDPGNESDTDGIDNQRLFPASDTATTAEDTVLEIAATDLLANDIHDGALTVIGVRTAIGGHGSAAFGGSAVRFTPEPDYHGPAFFSYIVTDGISFGTAFVDVTVTAVNDVPIASADLAATNEDTRIVILATALLANDADVDGAPLQPLALTSVGDASHGSVALRNDAITFVPDPNYNGAASFTYTVSDGVATGQGRVTVNVNSINDAPVAVDDDDAAITVEDTPIAIPVATLLANDTDIDVATDGQVLRVTAVAGARLADGVVTFTPGRNFAGTTSFSYTVSDGIFSSSADVSVLVTPVNDPPTFPPRTLNGSEDSLFVFNMSDLLSEASDPENDPFSVTGVRATPATHGTVVLSSDRLTFRYTPERDYNGPAQFEVLLSDGRLTGVSLVTINLAALPGAGPGTPRSR
jgi:large repetitive protein